MAEDKYRQSLKAGDFLFKEGDPGDCAFVIESGQLEIVRGDEVLALLGPGEMIGEMSLLDQLPRSASAKARVETKLRVLTRQHLDDKLEEGDPLLRLLLNMILKRYRAATSGGKAVDEDHKDREAVLKRLKLEQELEQALERREFVLYYQPIVDLNTYAVAGFEGLIRWISPTRGFVSPGEFMPVVEDSHLVHGVGKWVLEEGCAAVKRLSALARPVEPEPLFMSLNLSGRQFEDPDLLDIVRAAITAAGVEPP
jgi:CRP-like cAMP-binding protein